MWRKGSKRSKRFGGGGAGGEPPAKRQAAGKETPSEDADDSTVVAQVLNPNSQPTYGCLSYPRPLKKIADP